MAINTMGLQIIEQPTHPGEQWLLETVQNQARLAGIGMPDVAIYDSPDMNAFATGMNRDNALVAVSTGLLQTMEQDEVEAVLAHEVSSHCQWRYGNFSADSRRGKYLCDYLSADNWTIC
jgi:heat shock protein HtpX